MKIIVAHPGKQHAYRLLNCLHKQGHEIVFCSLFVLKKSRVENNIFLNRLAKYFVKRIISEKDIQLKHWPLLEFFRQILNKLFKCKTNNIQFYFECLFDKKVAKWLENQNFDIFIGYETSSKYSFITANRMGKKTILDLAQIHYNEIDELANKYLELSALKQNKLRHKINKTKQAELSICTHIFAISDFVKKSLLKNNISESKISLVHIGNDKLKENIFLPVKTKRPFTILYVGTIRQQKGIKLLIECFNELSDFEIELKLIGAITENEFYPLIKSNAKITHINFISNDELFYHYNSASIFILPSFLDSWGMVVLEAMSCGTPVIVTKNTGAKEAVEKGGGIIVAPNNKNELKEAILKYYSDNIFLNQKSKEAKTVANDYSFDLYKKELQLALNNASN